MIDSNASAAHQDLFLKNMRALWHRDSELALRVDAVDDDRRFPLQKAKTGGLTTKRQNAKGESTYLHSRYDPVKEARRIAEGVEIENTFCFVVLGMGLGYHVRALADRLRGDAFIVVAETSIELIATALTCVDLAEMITSNRLIFLTSPEKNRLHNRLQNHNTLMMMGAKFVQHPPSMGVAGEELNLITSAITEFVTFTRMSLMTLVGNSKLTCQNIAMNLVHYMSTPLIDGLRNRFRKQPGVVVSAGPSLRKNIELLSEVKGKAVLCAVQTTLRPLLQRGITPDFVTSLDFHEMSRKFFEGVGDLSRVHLVAEPKATWHVLDCYPGPMSILDSPWARLLLDDDLAARDGLKAGATVAHLAFYLLAYMGCDPIIFVGQDLAFTGHVFYVPGVEIHHTWRSELNRFNTMEMKEWDRIARNRSILRKVQGVDGSTLYADELLFTYLEQFEKDITEVPSRVINATEGGAQIRGTVEITLREAIDQFCQQAIPPECFAYLDEVNWRQNSKLPQAIERMETRIHELDDVIALCDEMTEVLKELEGLTHDPARFNRRLVRVDDLRAKVQRGSRAYRIVVQAIQYAEFRRYQADRRLSLVGDDDEIVRAKKQLERDLEFVGGIRDGAVEVKPILQESVDRMRKRIES